jgi:uncharacterized membrane protein (UPF0127 family)
MSKKKSAKRKSNKENKNKFFQITAGIVMLSIIVFFVFSTFNKNSKNNESTKLKTITAYDFVKHGELTFQSAEKEFISKIDIEIAEDDESRTQGLMYRDNMKESQGMFFIFPYEFPQSFWMRNTVMSLDIIFVNKANEIVKIHKNAVPFDENSYPSVRPAIYVVEVVAGYSEKYGLKEGDRIIWRRM